MRPKRQQEARSQQGSRGKEGGRGKKKPIQQKVAERVSGISTLEKLRLAPPKPKASKAALVREEASTQGVCWEKLPL